MTRSTDAVRSAVRAALADLPADGARLVLVACSGGPDSLALAAGTAEAARQLDWRAGAVVVDHGLQEGSAAVAERAAGQCEALGLHPVLVERAEVAGGGGPEAAARRARYAAIASAASRCGADAVLVAHSLDDQAETVLLGLARGSGARSLSGMPRIATVPGSVIPLVRPLLGLRRSVLVGACADWRLDPWLDPHNDSPRFARSRVRNELLPELADTLGAGISEALARTADLLRDDEAALSGLAEQHLSSWRAAGRLRGGAGSLVADTEELLTLPPAVRRRVLRSLALQAGCPPTDLTADHLVAVDRLLTAARSRGPIALPGRVAVRRGYGTVEFVAQTEGSNR